MKKTSTIIIIIVLIAMAVIATYYLAPWKAWKKYKENHPSLFDTSLLLEGEHVPYYSDFIKSWWKTMLKFAKGEDDEITYGGGELPEIVVTPN